MTRRYSVGEVLAAAEALHIPVVFDVFHQRWNPAFLSRSLRRIVRMVMATRRAIDGRPKLHYSDQWPGKPPGAHTASMDAEALQRLYDVIADLDLDRMLEVKGKEQSVLKLSTRPFQDANPRRME
jgi:UV DNA damage endonuclease